VLFLTGHSKPGGNDFSGEVSAIRRWLDPAHVTTHEYSRVEVAEIARLLDRHRPTILHLAAHAELGSVCLALEGEPSFTLYPKLASAILRAATRPALVTLNFCDSTVLGRQLSAHVRSVVCWTGLVDDAQAEVFAAQLYRHLATRRSLPAAVDDAAITVTARFAGLRPPILLGKYASPLFG
jgi:hypothetical protein